MKKSLTHMKYRWRCVSVSAFFCLLLTLALAQVGSVYGQPLTDLGILGAVEEEFLADPVLNHNQIIVTVADGVVTLSGQVSTLLKQERADRLAGTVRGVKAVVNNLVVKPAAIVADKELRQQVLEALLFNPATDAYEIRVQAQDGTVELRGTVDSFAEKYLAGQVAKHVRGVKKLVNLLEIDAKKTRIDSEIEADVRQSLRWDALVNSGHIEVEVTKGVVILTGKVKSLAEKNRAILDAWVAGVKELKAENLKVDPLTTADTAAVVVIEPMTDQDIRTAVENALLLDPRVNSNKVTAMVEDGVVTLSGAVESLQAYNAAEYAAHTRSGVLLVRNHLKIAPDKPMSDKAIAANLHKALIRDPYVERYEISANVIDGVVYLAGKVDNRFDKIQAGVVASGVKGVTRVVNNLGVDNPVITYLYDPFVDLDYSPQILTYEYRPTWTTKSDGEILLSIRDQLFWSPFVDANQVTAQVEDGIATLTGKVDSKFEANAAVENAFDGGALWVKNRLQVDAK